MIDVEMRVPLTEGIEVWVGVKNGELNDSACFPVDILDTEYIAIPNEILINKPANIMTVRATLIEAD